MRTVQFDLSDQQAEALRARAAEEGLSIEDWIQKLALHASERPRPGSIDWSECNAVESVPGKLSGAWVLKGTRMPVSAIFENLEAGANVDDILEWFAGLDRGQVQDVIEFAVRSLGRPGSFAP